MSLRLPIAAVLVVLTAAARADDLADFVARLDAPTRAERVAAERALLDRGPAVLPRLDDLARGSDRSPATAEALRRIIATLERREAEASVAASRVTLDVTGTLGDALAAVAEQTGNEFVPTPEQAASRLAVKVTDEPFWPAVDRMLSRTALEPGPADAEGRLTLRERSKDRVVAHDGPFRLAAGPVERRPIAGGGGTLLRVPVAVAVEPRLRPLFLAYAASDFALAAGDATLPPFTPGAKLELPLGERGATADLRLDFVAGDAVADSFRLTGELAVTLAAGTERFEFPLAGETASERRRGGVTVRLRDRKAAAGSAEVEVAVVYDRGGPAFESHRTWVFHNAARLVGPDGGRIEREPGFSTVAQTDGGVAVRYRFAGVPQDAAGWRFVYEAPTLIVTVPMRVAIDAVPTRGERGASAP